MADFGIVTCPKCKTRVLPKQDGTCPSCQAVISSKEGVVKQKTSSTKSDVQPRSNKNSVSTNAVSRRKLATRKPPHATKTIKDNTSNHDFTKQHNPTVREISIQSYKGKLASSAIFCQSCGREAQTKYVEYYQNIGVLVMRFSKNVKGHLCKDCSNKYFWSLTGITLFLGWWGIISFIVTLFILPNNLIRYLGTLGLESPDPAMPHPILTEAVVERIMPFTVELFQRVNVGEELEQVARSIAPRAKVSPGQVIVYVFALAQKLKEK